LAAACSSSGSSKARSPEGSDANHNAATVTVDAGLAARQLEYLHFATRDSDPGNALNDIAHLELAARDPNYRFDAAVITPEAFSHVFKAIEGFEDTTDFDVLYLLNLRYAFGSQIPVATRDAIDKHLALFKYWYTEPTPPGVVDNKYYWSENHRIIYHVDE